MTYDAESPDSERIGKPVYTLTLAFDSRPLATCFGLEGLRDTIRRRGPDLYMIRDSEGREVGTASRWFDGDWRIELANGLSAGPGVTESRPAGIIV
jgi:hypothetical protein